MTVIRKITLGNTEPTWEYISENNDYTFQLSGDWLTKNDNIPEFPSNFFKNISRQKKIMFDTKAMTAWDSSLITFLWDIKQQATDKGLSLDNSGLPEEAQRLFSLLSDRVIPKEPPSTHPFRPLYNLGGWAVDSLTNLGVTTQLLIGSLQGVIRYLTGRSYMRLVDLLRDIKASGPSALIIISVVNFLVGAILGFVGAVQLKKFSADIYVANLVGIATVREMAAVMTAIVISGRTGGAYAARIATMQGNEEIDALKVMGIPITEYIILPSMLSLVLTMPVLYLYGCFMGVFGGLCVSILMLKVSVIGFFQQTVGAVPFNQFIFGIIKTIAFAMFIGVSSCHIGMKSGRSAADVGIAATKAVVTGIVGVITIDAIFAVIADMIGI